MKFKFIDCISVLSVVLIFLFSISATFPSSHKEVKITDWVSVFINILIAYAAIKGVNIARDWKKALTDGKIPEEGHKLKFDTLDKCNESIFKFLPMIFEFQLPSKASDDFFNDKDTIDFFLSYHRFNRDIDNVRDSVYDIHDAIERIRFLGWDFCDDKLVEFDNINHLVDELYVFRFQLDNLMNDFFTSKDIYFKGDREFPTVRYKSDAADIADVKAILNDFFSSKERLSDFKRTLDNMISTRGLFINSLRLLTDRNGRLIDLIMPLK
ncbi:hypothetical protein ACFL9S_03895 [Erwinia sp. AnSW2-5]|uniref:hypothetical protein n=1 Tax=Erwinia sp. AnSW2-5 TaxID=3367692 RepID=UPI00385EF813